MNSSAKEKKETQHIHAYARLRPFNQQEIDCNARKCLEINGRDINVALPHGSKKYSFDKVFDTKSQQKDVYMTIIHPIIDEIIQGYNCTVFTYGQTGTGKTYTMIGNEGGQETRHNEDSEAGIIPRILGHLFDYLSKNADLDCTIRVSYLELYNEVLIDLLSRDEKVLRIYEDQRNKGSVQIHGLEEVTVFSKNQVYDILAMGNERKRTAATLMNAHSSRSHTVFTITLHSRETTPESEDLLKMGKLNLVDLAGSENILRSGAIEKRAREAGNINQSLLTLGRVIKSLVEKSPHVPYRESKLTRILQDSLGGKTKTTIIATVSPASNNLEETMSTLDYAFRARNITNRPEINQKMSKKGLIQRYLEEIERLKKDVQAAWHKDGIYLNPDNYNSLIAESEQRKQDLLKTVEEFTKLQESAEEIDRMKKELEEVHQVTVEELEQSSLILAKSKENIKKLRKQRRLHQKLIDKYDDAQTVMRNTTKALTQELDEYFKDHNMLRDKVDNLYEAIEVNTSNSQDLLQHYTEQYEVFKQEFDKHSDNNVNKLDCLKARFFEFSEASKKFNKQVQDQLVNFQMLSDNKIDDITKTIHLQFEEGMKYLVNEGKINGAVKDMSCLLLRSITTDTRNTCQHSEYTLDALLNAYDQDMAIRKYEMLDLLGLLHETELNIKNEFYILIGKLERKIKEVYLQMENMNKYWNLMKLKKIENDENAEKQIDNFQQQMNREIEKYKESLKINNTKTFATYQALDNQFTDLMSNQQSFSPYSKDSIVVTCHEMSRELYYVKDAIMDEKDRQDACEGQLQCLLDSLQLRHMDVRENVEKNEQVAVQIHETSMSFKKRVDKQKMINEEIRDNLLKHTSDLSELVQISNKNAVVPLQEANKNITECIETVDANVNESRTDMLKEKESIARNAEINLELIRRFDDQFRRVQCVGNTPGRKESKPEVTLPKIVSKKLLGRIQLLDDSMGPLTEDETLFSESESETEQQHDSTFEQKLTSYEVKPDDILATDEANENMSNNQSI